jgi:hypothetical protein
LAGGVSLLTEYSGHVVDASGDPVPEATIVIVESSVPMPEIALLADENGRFVVRLPPGHFRLRAHDPAGEAGEVELEIGEGEIEFSIVIGRGLAKPAT